MDNKIKTHYFTEDDLHQETSCTMELDKEGNIIANDAGVYSTPNGIIEAQKGNIIGKVSLPKEKMTMRQYFQKVMNK